MATRRMPETLSRSWERVLGDPDAVEALGATRALYKDISSWQAELVSEAIRDGATWEDIGAALGTTRQAAWARFRTLADQIEGRPRQMAEQVEAVKRRLREEVSSLRTELKQLDAKWRQERTEAVQQMRAMERARAGERKALQDKIRETAVDLREEIRSIRERAEPG